VEARSRTAHAHRCGATDYLTGLENSAPAVRVVAVENVFGSSDKKFARFAAPSINGYAFPPTRNLRMTVTRIVT
jgi:hypothetical protein